MMAEINVVPYIDVMLVLLIIFMVTTPLLTQGVSVQLPKAQAEVLPDSQVEPLLISVDREGHLYVNVGDQPQQPITEMKLKTQVSGVITQNPKAPILIKADEKVPYGRVVEVMVMLQKVGASKVGFVTDPSGSHANVEAQPSS
jgi:biopolymer transport protein TolR